MTHLPFNPQPIEQLRGRVHEAMRTVYSPEFCQRFPAEGPSFKPEHVFDFVHNDVQFRVLISIDESKPLGRILHVSCSCNRGIPSVGTATWAFSQIYGHGVLYSLGECVITNVTHLMFKVPERAREACHANR